MTCTIKDDLATLRTRGYKSNISTMLINGLKTIIGVSLTSLSIDSFLKGFLRSEKRRFTKATPYDRRIGRCKRVDL